MWMGFARSLKDHKKYIGLKEVQEVPIFERSTKEVQEVQEVHVRHSVYR